MSAENLHQFLSISLLAGPGVLAPRAETELLGRTVLALLADTAEPLVIDMCCGSGNLGLAIAHARPDAEVLMSDLTDETVAQARSNVERLGLGARVQVGQGDLFAGVDPLLRGRRADLIVCNPPYISTGKLEGESAHLLENEPREAFDAGAYGIAIHQRLIAEAPDYLAPDGRLAFEFGHGQERQISLLFRRSGLYAPVELIADALGQPRVAHTKLAHVQSGTSAH
nr:HemK/PrmC family methyltransferase [Devosia crocina]